MLTKVAFPNAKLANCGNLPINFKSDIIIGSAVYVLFIWLNVKYIVKNILITKFALDIFFVSGNTTPITNKLKNIEKNSIEIAVSTIPP